MENETKYTAAEITLSETKKELLRKLGLFAACMAVIFFFLKAFNSGEGGESVFGLLRDSFDGALAFYLPFRIGYKLCRSIILGAIIGLVLLVVVGAFTGISSILLSIILLGGCAVDFGRSIIAFLKARQLAAAEQE